MNKYRIWNFALGTILMFQAILFGNSEQSFLSGFGLGIGFNIIFISEFILPIAKNSYNQKGGQREKK